MSLRRVVAATLTAWLALTSAPASAQEPTYLTPPPPPWFEGNTWNADDPIPAGYTPIARKRSGLIITGVLLLTIPYSIGFTGVGGNAVVNGPSYLNWLALPGAGPLVVMAETAKPLGNVVLSADALMQLGGIAMIVCGLVIPRTVLTRDGPPSFMVTPVVGSGQGGMSIVGRF